MRDDKTKREDLTRVEREDLTKVERIPSEGSLSLKYFRDYKVVKEFPASGGEADSFLIEKNSSKFFLKLYRKGIDPNIELLQKLKEISTKHREHLVEMIDVGYDEGLGRYYEVLEYVEWGDLKRVIKEISGLDYKQKEPIIDKAIEEIAEALKVLHQENIVHRDLKPSNILVRDRKSLDLVLIDFGIARQIREDVSKVATTSFKGTTYYIAPEEISGYFGKEIDWWHLGVIVYELLKGKNPFAGLSEQVVIHTLVTKGIEIPSDIPEKYKLLLRGLLTRDYRKRWGYEQIKAWLRGERDIPVYYEEKVYTEDEWIKYGFPKDSPWRTFGLSPEEAQDFRDAGFSVYEAKRWIEAGWRNGKGAKRWRDAGFEPEESLVFEQLGLSTSDARSIKDAGITAYDLSKVKEVIKHSEDLQGFLKELSEMLKSSQGTVEGNKIAELIKEYSYWCEKGFKLKKALEWFIEGISSDEAKEWKDAEFELSEAKEWRNAGFEPSEARGWIDAEFTLSEAINWKNAGFKSSEAKEWRSAGFELSEAKAWKDAGFELLKARDWINAKFEPSEAKKWKYAGFDPLKAKRWKTSLERISLFISFLVSIPVGYKLYSILIGSKFISILSYIIVIFGALFVISPFVGLLLALIILILALIVRAPFVVFFLIIIFLFAFSDVIDKIISTISAFISIIGAIITKVITATKLLLPILITVAASTIIFFIIYFVISYILKLGTITWARVKIRSARDE